MMQKTALLAIVTLTLAGCQWNKPRPDRHPTSGPEIARPTATSAAGEPDALPPAWIGTIGFHAAGDYTWRTNSGLDEHWQGSWDGTWTLQDPLAAHPATYPAEFSLNGTGEHTSPGQCRPDGRERTKTRSLLQAVSARDTLTIYRRGDQLTIDTLHAGTLAGLNRTRFTDPGCPPDVPPIDKTYTDVVPSQRNSPSVTIDLGVPAGTRTVTGSAPEGNPGPISVGSLPWTGFISGPAIVPTVRWNLRLLPGECRDEHVTAAMLRTAGRIGGQSDTFERTAKELQGRVRFRDATGQLPRGAGRTTANAAGDAIIEVDYNQVDNRFHLTSVVAHEYGHAGQVVSRGFSIGDVAPATTLREYITLRWEGEAAAFDLQAKILKEIADTSPDLLPCLEHLLDQDKRLRPMTPREREVSVANSDEYNITELTKQYQRDRTGQVSPQAQAAWDKFVKSGDLAPITQRWSNYLQ